MCNFTFAFYFSSFYSTFPLRVSEAILTSISLPLATIENDVLYTAGRQTERELLRQITRQIDQEVVELPMQRITAVTTCDHRTNERKGDRKSDRRRARERAKAKKQVRKSRGGGGVVESKKRIERWRGIDVPHAIYRTLNYPTAACRQQLLRR